jgi:hypothetical protein
VHCYDLRRTPSSSSSAKDVTSAQTPLDFNTCEGLAFSEIRAYGIGNCNRLAFRQAEIDSFARKRHNPERVSFFDADIVKREQGEVAAGGGKYLASK